MSKLEKVKPVQVIGNWTVFENGTLKGNYTNPAGLTSELTIYPDKLTDDNLILRLYRYQAVAKSDWYDFIGAFAAACEIIGLDQVVVKLAARPKKK